MHACSPLTARLSRRLKCASAPAVPPPRGRPVGRAIVYATTAPNAAASDTVIDGKVFKTSLVVRDTELDMFNVVRNGLYADYLQHGELQLCTKSHAGGGLRAPG